MEPQLIYNEFDRWYFRESEQVVSQSFEFKHLALKALADGKVCWATPAYWDKWYHPEDYRPRKEAE
jgi:hypothetical protein